MGQSDASMSLSTGEDVVVLVVGADPICDPLCTALAARGADVRQVNTDGAVEAVVASAPDVTFLVGDAARQRGTLVRSQLVRRLRGADINIAVLIDGNVAPPTNAATRMLMRASGIETIAEQLMAWGEAARALRMQGTLDQVAGIVARALERPSQPAPTTNSATAAHIMMQAAPSRAPVPPAPADRISRPTAGPARSVAAATRRLATPPVMRAPPLSLQALAAPRREIAEATTQDPTPIAATTHDPTPIETESAVGDAEVTQSIGAVEIPIAVEFGDLPSPTPLAWSSDRDSEEVTSHRPASRRRNAVAAIGAALAACGGLVVWYALHSTSIPATTAAGRDAAKLVTRDARSDAHNVDPIATDPREQPPQPRDVATTNHTDAPVRTLAAATIDDDQEADPVGDEPTLVRARELCGEGHTLRAHGRLGLAEAKYLEALSLFPRYPRAMAGVVRVHLTRGDGAEAVRWAERLVAMQPNRSNNQLLVGDAYALSGKANEARQHWRQSAAYGNAAARKRLKNDEATVAKRAR
jgi:hypothetical protein